MQINPAQALEVALTCGPLTYFLVTGIILFAIATAAMWVAYHKKDKLIRKLGESNSRINESFIKALDMILVDDKENAEAIKALLKEIHNEIKANKELFIVKLNYIEKEISDGK